MKRYLPFVLSGLFAASAAASPADHPPIRLVVEPVGDGIHLTVVGSSAADFEGVYTLQVDSDVVEGNGSRSVQRGRAHLRPGEGATFISLRLGDVVPGRWQARLLVEPEHGEPYEEIRNSL